MTRRTLSMRLFVVTAIALAVSAAPRPADSQELSRFERDRARMMLNIVKKDLQKYYYDEGFRGLNIEEAFGIAAERIDQAKSVSQLFAGIARPLLQLNDSHTFFVPPGRAARIRFGWEMQMIGDRCYLTAMQEGSDAEKKGLKKGDIIQSVDGMRPTRDNLWGMNYVHRVLSPRVNLPLMVQTAGGEPRKVEVEARVVEGTRLKKLDFIFREMDESAHLERHRYTEVGESLVIWKMTSFDLNPDDVRTRMIRVVKKRPNFILDLRNNGGGAVESLEALVGALVGEKTKIGDVKSREPLKPLISRDVGEVYDGKVVVLVDSNSASASELFARTMQLAGRAKVIGDRTSGSVMESRTYDHMIGDNSGIFFATSITIADIIMPDGKSLEHTGVVPDEIRLPTAEDLTAGRDPVLSYAASLLGVTIDPETAGKYFPVEWKK